MSNAEKKENMVVTGSKILMKQIEDRDGQAAFWMVSCLSTLRHANPQMNLICLMNIIKDGMPKAHGEYQEYLKNT